MGKAPIFLDRRDAGRRLAKELERFRPQNPVIIGLPRGGVPVAAEVAKALEAPLDVLVVRKLGAPWQPELAIGAIAEGIQHLDEPLIRALGISRESLVRVITVETAELARREQAYRHGRKPVPVEARTVIVVDDGLATGSSARVALKALRLRRPARLILAVPVCSPEAHARLGGIADEVVCAESPPDFQAVGPWYYDFSPTSEEAVLAALDAAQHRTRESARAPSV